MVSLPIILLPIVIGLLLYLLFGRLDKKAKAVPTAAMTTAAAIDARRFAKLLLAEIRMYNATKVASGRRNKNLYSELRPEIEHAYQVFAQRANPKINIEAIFREALARELADGDERNLGTEAR